MKATPSFWRLSRLFWLVVLIAASGWGYKKFLYVPTIATTQISRGTAITAVYASGSVEPTVLLRVAPKLTGRLAALLADEHDKVNAGQVLARLDDSELAANFAQAQARLALAEQEANRAAALLARGTGTKQARDKAMSAAQEARAMRAMASKQQAEYTLLAPADGTIIRRDGEVGEVMPANQPIFHMACCAPLRVTAEVDEEDIPLVQVGQKVLLRADAFPEQSFTGTVAAITPKGDATARNFRVRITLPTNHPLLIGMNVEVNIIVAEQNDAWLLPASAVRDGKVWVIKNERLEPVTVTAKPTNSGQIAITAPTFTASDVIVTTAQSEFGSGQRYRAADIVSQ